MGLGLARAEGSASAEAIGSSGGSASAEASAEAIGSRVLLVLKLLGVVDGSGFC